MNENHWGDAPEPAEPARRRWLPVVWILGLLLLGFCIGFRTTFLWSDPERVFLPADFSHQSLILVAIPDELAHVDESLGAELVKLLSQNGTVWCEESLARRAEEHSLPPGDAPPVERREVSLGDIQILPVEAPAAGARAFPWRVIKDAKGECAVLAPVTGEEERQVAQSLQLAARNWDGPPWSRLLSNGAGLWLIAQQGDEQQSLGQWRQLLEQSGEIELVTLESLEGANGAGRVEHIAAFVAADTVLVGRADPLTDARNAQILDRNADKLSGLRTPFGPLRVVRVPLPPAHEGVVRSYTSLILFNRLAVVPRFSDAATLNQEVQSALAGVLPNWRIELLNCDEIARQGGSLHDLVLPIACTSTSEKQP